MPASYPSATKSFTTKVDGAGNTIAAAHVNDLQDEVVAVETELRAGLTSYTPTWSSSGTAPALGNGTLTGQYHKVGKLVFVIIKLTYGSTSTPGTGAWTFSLPFTAAGLFGDFVSLIKDQGTQFYTASAYFVSTTTIGVVYTGHTGSGIQAAQPITWAVDDSVSITGCYVEA